MSNRLPYAGWAALMLRQAGMESDQDVRAALYSADGRIEHYDRYRGYCDRNGYQADPPPDGYWESKIKPHHTITGQLIGLAGLLAWFLMGIITGSLGARRQ